MRDSAVMQTFSSGIRAKYEEGKRKEDASCGFKLRGIIPGSPISRNLLNILQSNGKCFRIIQKIIYKHYFFFKYTYEKEKERKRKATLRFLCA